MPVGGNFTGCGCGPDAEVCDSPTQPVATVGLCLADGTPIAVTVVRDCAGAVTSEGWIDLNTGAYTSGPAPAGAGACDAGCVDTVCRTLCDDTDGDGQADTTYSELWCIRANGSAELVLTYQDDPSVPYTPTAPVDCEYGCPQTETVQLCDDAGAFLRRYTWLQGAASFEDWALDGATPHVVTGTVRQCAASSDCDAATTPAATLGLCLADGTPIAVLVTRDCDGLVTQDGWLNLTTGAWSAGDPPAGTMACGNPRSITTAGVFCDVDPATGDVLGLVLVEYTYGSDGAVASVRLVDAITGQTYTPQGEVTTCPAGVEQPERDVLQLCDTATDGTVTEFVRDYTRDENGTITGHTDYRLDGTPYTPAGTVGRCVQECQDCQTVILCDTDPASPAAIAGTEASGTLPNNVAWTATASSPQPPSQQSDGAAWWGMGTFPNPSVPLNTWTFDQPVTVEFSVAMLYSTGTNAGENTVQLPAGAVPVSLPPGYTYDPAANVVRGDASLTDCAILNAPTRETSARFRVTGVTSLQLRYLGGRTAFSNCQRIGSWLFGALDVSVGGTFARTVCRDCTGAVTSTTDTLLDGTTPYVPVGTVGVCGPAPATQEEPCRNTSTLLLCDLPAEGEHEGASTATDDTASLTYNPGPGHTPLPGGAPPLWAGDPFTIPSDPDGSAGSGDQVYRMVSARLTPSAAVPDCNDGTVTVTAAMDVTNDGPAAGGGYSGRLLLLSGGVQVDEDPLTGSSPVGVTQHRTVTAQVPLADFEAGAVEIILMVETWQSRPKSWTAQSFTASYEVGQPSSGCAPQFLRTIVTDCETGQIVSSTDTTLDGQPYTPTGEVGQCVPTGGGGECCPPPEPEPCRDSTTLLVCDLPTGGTPEAAVTDTDPTPYYPYPTAAPVAGAQALWDGGTLDLPPGTGPQPGTTGSVNSFAAIVQAPRPACDTGTARVAVSLTVQQTGPDDGCGPTGHLRIFNGTTQAGLTVLPANTPNGFFGTLTVEADVPAADLAAGNLAFALALDAFDDSPTTCMPSPRRTGWQLSAFTATAVYDQTGCETQFLRTVLTDCDTGTVLTVTDTTLDGQPYTVTGEVGQCLPAGGGEAEPPPPCEAHNLLTACRCDDTTGDGLADTEYVELLAVDCAGTLTSIGTYTPDLSAPYTPVAPMPCESGSEDADPAYGVQAHRIELAPGASWSAATYGPALRSVTAVAHTGPGEITTADGSSTLFQGESVTWSIDKGQDAGLVGPLTITATGGIVTVTYTLGGIQL
ncbi:hypothetical protein KYY02_19530 [Streptomyces pimonensis]|uniref:Uncharacterized protein n=1 Tax=Streptomyces pimonensis TaxID=2860288 RepID=A0ABV4J1J0_9ACTN